VSGARWLAVGVAAAAVCAGAVYGPPLYARVRVGTGYLAKQMCSCVHVARRDFAACRRDMPASMDRLEVEPLPDGSGMRARLFGLAERVATRDPAAGCTLE
jgi:hypothetical protein